MSRSSGNRWSSTSNDDYHSHVSRMMRMPSVLPDVPHYPNVHYVFNRKEVTNCHEEEEVQPKESPNHHHKNQHSAQFQDQVQVIEFEDPTSSAETTTKKSSEADDKEQECVDAKADGFINQKRKGFGLCKWDTFKVH